MDFRDKTVVITGASSGIGRALAVALAERGTRLVLGARGADELAATVSSCEAAGARAIGVPTDVADEAACSRLIDAAVAAFGGVDVLVNNAGISMWARFDELEDMATVERVMRVNYLGSVYCTHHALPHLEASRGLLVAISSLTGKFGTPTRSAYAASKHAVQGFFDSLRVELVGTGVDVLVVSPGFVATDIRAHAVGPDGRPRGVSPRDEARGTMPLDVCVRQIVKAMERRDRELVMTAKGRIGLWLRLLAPSLVDRMAARALRERK
jgi:NAD(P)-dependent dehydrogenase (short-subunit alcohol dehydrogenase family)